MTIPGGWELLVVLFIVVLLFGAKRLPELSRSLGTSIREFRRATGDDDAEADEQPRVTAPRED